MDKKNLTAEETFALAVQNQKKNNLQIAEKLYRETLKINPNHVDARNNLGIIFQALGEFQKAVDCFQKVIQIQPDRVDDAHVGLGLVFKELGEHQKAMSCYEKAIEIDPNYAGAYDNLGNILVILKKFNEAIKIYQQALRLKPGDKFISHVLSALFGNTTKTAPKEYVVKLFDNFADSFDKKLTEKLKYRVLEKLVALLKKTTSQRLNFKHAIDVGCGTGLSGSAFRPLTDYLVGIDISKKMIEKASDKNIYDYVEQGDISTYLTKSLKKFDLFISTDVFIYVGDLDEVFSKVSAKSNLNAKFCFSVEKCEDNEFKLLKSARYAHSKEYIDRLSKRYKFIIESYEETEIRTESDIPLTGYIFILRKI